jgi:chemotaxis signal transduction protein
MTPSPPERRALLFTAGGVRLALRLSAIREVVTVPAGASEVETRGQLVPAVPLGLALGLGSPPGPIALLTDVAPPVALRVDAVEGIVDLAGAEVFRLPARTLLPQPPPFQGALVIEGAICLELALTSAGWIPLEPAEADWQAPPENDLAPGRELVFERGDRRLAVPISILLRVMEAPRIFPVPLAPASHRGLLYHQRAIHPVFDVAGLYGGAPAQGEPLVLLVDAGGTAVGILADRIAAAGDRGAVLRPAWDALFAP